MNTIEDISITVTTGGNAGQVITLSRGDLATVGRSNGADFQVDDVWLSRNHFRIEHDGHCWTLIDLDSRHGTLVNDEKKRMAVLRKDDVVFAGSTRFCITFGQNRSNVSNAAKNPTSVGIKYILKSLASKNSAYDVTLGDSES